jgi:NAD+ kinase
MATQRAILIVVHPARPDAAKVANELALQLIAENFLVFTNQPTLATSAQEYTGSQELELAVVFGGDGTILRAAELVHGKDVPILGVNLGNVGFLAQLQKPSLSALIESIVSQRFHTEPRLTISYTITRNKQIVHEGWGLNEVTVERGTNQMVELFVQIDGRPLSRWGCDGVICATPTGSTAYAFSAGGPVLWPEVNALVLVPLAAHALFAKPMVISPDSHIVIEIESATAEISADGMRKFDLKHGDQITLTRSTERIHLAYIEEGVFTDRLVAKFKLPVEGWRGGEK